MQAVMDKSIGRLKEQGKEVFEQIGKNAK